MPGEKEALEKRESEVGGKRIGVRKKKKMAKLIGSVIVR